MWAVKVEFFLFCFVFKRNERRKDSFSFSITNWELLLGKQKINFSSTLARDFHICPVCRLQGTRWALGEHVLQLQWWEPGFGVSFSPGDAVSAWCGPRLQAGTSLLTQFTQHNVTCLKFYVWCLLCLTGNGRIRRRLYPERSFREETMSERATTSRHHSQRWWWDVSMSWRNNPHTWGWEEGNMVC